MSPEALRSVRSIESARTFETAIEIISEKECRMGIAVMQEKFREMFPDPTSVSVVPILNGGKDIGEALCAISDVEQNPMQMSYYDEKNQRLDKPRCIIEPNIEKIIRSQSVVFAEAVVDSQATILEAIEHIKTMIDAYNAEHHTSHQYPSFHTYALASKVNGNASIQLTAMFAVDPRIWIHGWGCDNAQKGRDERRIMGMLAPDAKDIPEPPYYKCLFTIPKRAEELVQS